MLAVWRNWVKLGSEVSEGWQQKEDWHPWDTHTHQTATTVGQWHCFTLAPHYFWADAERHYLLLGKIFSLQSTLLWCAFTHPMEQRHGSKVSPHGSSSQQSSESTSTGEMAQQMIIFYTDGKCHFYTLPLHIPRRVGDDKNKCKICCWIVSEWSWTIRSPDLLYKGQPRPLWFQVDVQGHRTANCWTDHESRVWDPEIDQLVIVQTAWHQGQHRYRIWSSD